jgi:hypothetical protein
MTKRKEKTGEGKLNEIHKVMKKNSLPGVEAMTL